MTCTCRKFGCTHHWKLKDDIQFKDYVAGFLRTFVDCHNHQPILNALDGNTQVNLNSRSIGAFRILQSLEKNWPVLVQRAARHNKTLFCDNWADEFFKKYWSFSINGSIYKAKQYCILLPDICVPYDTASREKLSALYHLQNSDYYNLLSHLRETFLTCMKDEHLDLPNIRRLDSPQGQVPFKAGMISLPRQGFQYGSSYQPTERQISIVLDKCFYQPTTISKNSEFNNRC